MQRGGGASQSGVSEKWMRINQIAREGCISILALQETHIMKECLAMINDLFKATMLVVVSPDPENLTAVRGVAVALNKRLIETNGLEVNEIIPGRALEIRIQWTHERKLMILAVYAPNNMTDNAEFWELLTQACDASRMHAPNILLGDMNIVHVPLDCLPPRADNAAAEESLNRLE